jgi:hypothetical protein
VYHRTATPQELQLIEAQEQRALQLSHCSLVLSRSDAQYLRRHFPEEAAAAPLHVLLPALRADMEALPPPQEEGEEQAGQRQQQLQQQPQQQEHQQEGQAAQQRQAQAQQQGQQQEAQQQPPQQPQRCHRRRYLACCVRLSAEKEPHRFVELLEELQRRGSLQRLGVQPLMCCTGWESPYGQPLRQRLQQHMPQVGGGSGVGPLLLLRRCCYI